MEHQKAPRDPLFQFCDDHGRIRFVNVVKNYDAFEKNQFGQAVADVKDVQTGEEFTRVALARLEPISMSSLP